MRWWPSRKARVPDYDAMATEFGVPPILVEMAHIGVYGLDRVWELQSEAAAFRVELCEACRLVTRQILIFDNTRDSPEPRNWVRVPPEQAGIYGALESMLEEYGELGAQLRLDRAHGEIIIAATRDEVRRFARFFRSTFASSSLR